MFPFGFWASALDIPGPPIDVRRQGSDAENEKAIRPGAFKYIGFDNAAQFVFGAKPLPAPGGHHRIPRLISCVCGGAVPGRDVKNNRRTAFGFNHRFPWNGRRWYGDVFIPVAPRHQAGRTGFFVEWADAEGHVESEYVTGDAPVLVCGCTGAVGASARPVCVESLFGCTGKTNVGLNRTQDSVFSQKMADEFQQVGKLIQAFENTGFVEEVLDGGVVFVLRGSGKGAFFREDSIQFSLGFLTFFRCEKVWYNRIAVQLNTQAVG